MTTIPQYKASGRKPGYDGAPLVEITLRDPEGEGKRKLKALRRVDLLDELERNGTIRRHHLEAGRRLQSDAELAECRLAKAQEPLSGSRTSQPTNATIEAVEARTRLKQAIAVLEAEDEIFIVAVLINRQSLTQAVAFMRKSLGVHWREDTGGQMLRPILYQLARHYGLA